MLEVIIVLGKHLSDGASAMHRALTLSRRGMGSVRPNPPVGAVLLRDGVVVGEGYHSAAGEPHAEILALEQAGGRARGGTLYVTLEPCNHKGKTPPCVPALVEAGIRRVHVAAKDPNSASGSGSEALARAGIEVVWGPGEKEAEYILAGFRSRMERGRPRFSLKMATSLDGRIAVPGGDSRWISSEVSRAWVHRRRREADAVLVGVGTALRDNPALTTRHVPGRNPDRFVLDSTLRTKPAARVWADNGARRAVLTTVSADDPKAVALVGQGVEVWTLPGNGDNRVSLAAAARRLGEEGYTNVFVEGGGVLSGSLFQSHLVDVAWIIAARHLLLGGGGPGWTEGLKVAAVPRAIKISRTDIRPLGPDWLMTLIPESAQWWDPENNHV